jgi:cell division septation protein DedD
MTSAEESEIEPASVQRRILLGFCATVLAGVLLCTAYLGRRATSSAPRAKTSALSVPVLPERNPQRDLQPAALPPQATPQPATQVQSLDTSHAGREPAPVAVVSRSDHTPGDTYLQIAAVDRGMAGVLVEVLGRKGFQAEVASGPTEDIFRVIVGPAKDAASLVRMKADLQAAGFTSFARKAPKLVASQRENEPDPETPQSPVADK